jgi:hypothetical protein
MTVVIPTRERAETLPYALQTVIDQDYDNLTIIVSDNCSNDGTADVVASMRDPRIRYVRTPARVSMSRNWEFGLSAVEDGFVTFIGDDDGLMPDAVRDAAAVLTAERVPAMVWSKAQYTWPSHPEPQHRNKLIVPLGNALVRCNARRVARDCARYWTAYYVAPCLYNSFVAVPAVQRVRQKSGAFFHSVTPDVYSGLAIASAIDEYVHLSRPFSINGASGRSNGASAHAYLRDTSANTEMARFVQEADLPLHPLIPEMVPGSVITLVLEAMLQANDYCYDGTLPIDLHRSIYKVIQEVQRMEDARYDSVVAAMQRVFGQGEHRGVLQAALRKYPHRPASRPPALPAGLSLNAALTLQTAPLGITNVHEAVRFAGNLLGPFTMPTRRGRYRSSAKYLSRGLHMVRARLAPSVWD